MSTAENPAGGIVTPFTLPVLLLTVFLGIIGLGVVVPLLPFYAEVFGAPAWQITLMFAAFSLGQFAGELFWGRLSDRIGRRPVLLITMGLSVVGYVALAFAPGVAVAILIRLLAGFFSGNISTIQGYIVDITPPEKLPARLGLVGAAFGVGFVVGPSLGGLLARPELDAAGFRPPLLTAAGLCLAAGAGVLLFVRESQAAHHRERPPLAALGALKLAFADPVLKRLIGTSFMGFCAFSAMWSVFGLWGQARFGWGPREVGLVMALTGVAAALSQGMLSGRLVRRIGETPTIAGGLCLTAACLVLQAFSPWAWGAILAMTAGVIGHTLTQPPTASLISRCARPEHQGAMLGANAAAASLSRVCGPIVAGTLFSTLGPIAPFWFAAIGMLPAAALAASAGRRLKARPTG